MGRILETVQRFFEQDAWPFTPLEDGLILKTGFNGDNGQFTCFAQEREKQQQFVFYAVGPVKVPEKDRLAVAEFLTRANYGLIIGNFELDFSDGEVRYKASLDVENAELSEALVKNLVYAAVLTMDRYITGIMRVMYGGATPVEAIQEIEG
jgi:hypothetical protein